MEGYIYIYIYIYIYMCVCVYTIIVVCAENCATCNDGTASQCTLCKPGYFLSGGIPGTCSGKEQQQTTTQ